jgi:hypothetical protein
MPDTEKYLNTTNRGREDNNKFGWKLGDVLHISGTWSRANGYDYCGYKEFNIPCSSRARIIGIKQTDLNASYNNGVGDVYIDFELLDHTNPDGTPITCGNRHAWTMAEANPDFALCPDGSEEPGYIREHRNTPGEKFWFSLEAERVSDHPEHGYVRYQHRKIVDPANHAEMDTAAFV